MVLCYIEQCLCGVACFRTAFNCLLRTLTAPNVFSYLVFLFGTWPSFLDACNDTTAFCFFPGRLVACALPLPPHCAPLCFIGRCSVILSWAGCLYDPRPEIWLARPECLSFFLFSPSLPISSLSPQVLAVSVHPFVLLPCMSPLGDQFEFKDIYNSPPPLNFISLRSCGLLFLDILLLFQLIVLACAETITCRKSVGSILLLTFPSHIATCCKKKKKNGKIECAFASGFIDLLKLSESRHMIHPDLDDSVLICALDYWLQHRI